MILEKLLRYDIPEEHKQEIFNTIKEWISEDKNLDDPELLESLNLSRFKKRGLPLD